MPRSRTFAALLLSLAVFSAEASDFPSAPVRITHGLPGGVVDAATRALGELLSVKWKQPVIVEGKPGANEMIAAETVTRGAKDGHNLLVATESVSINNGLVYRKPLVDAERELVPVHELFEIPFALIVRADLGVNSVQEFVALMKKDGKKYSYASAGVGSPLQLAMEGFARDAGFEIVHVPYKTLGQLQQDMAGGTLDAAFLGVNAALSFVKAGKLKLLAVTGSARHPAAPQAPTFGELGLRNVDYRTSIALLAPRGTPPQTLARITADVHEALHSEEFARRFLRAHELKASAADGRQYAEAMAARRAATKRLVDTLNIKLD